MAESKKMVGKEIAFMKKKGAPKSMVKHEEAEMKGMKKGGMACGGKMKKYAAGGAVGMEKVANKAVKGHEKRLHGMAKGGSVDGCASKGKTKGKMV
jgi:hypothetical protein